MTPEGGTATPYRFHLPLHLYYGHQELPAPPALEATTMAAVTAA